VSRSSTIVAGFDLGATSWLWRDLVLADWRDAPAQKDILLGIPINRKLIDHNSAL
jgi:hypothetical protein